MLIDSLVILGGLFHESILLMVQVSWLSQLLYMKPDSKKKHVYSTVYVFSVSTSHELLPFSPEFFFHQDPNINSVNLCEL